MKLIHTSDWHLGMPLGTGSYAEDQRHFLRQLYDLIEKEQVGAVLLSGDVYDSSVANAEAISLYNEAVTKICLELRCPMIVIAGNHDSAARLASCRELLKASGLYVTGRLSRDLEPVLLDGGRVAVYSLPFFGREEVIALFPEEKPFLILDDPFTGLDEEHLARALSLVREVSRSWQVLYFTCHGARLP